MGRHACSAASPRPAAAAARRRPLAAPPTVPTLVRSAPAAAAMPHVTATDLQQLTDICDSICYHLTAHLAAVASGASGTNLPPEVGQIYQLGSKLPKTSAAKWLALVPGGKGAKAAAAAAAAGGLPLAEGAKVAGECLGSSLQLVWHSCSFAVQLSLPASSLWHSSWCSAAAYAAPCGADCTGFHDWGVACLKAQANTAVCPSHGKRGSFALLSTGKRVKPHPRVRERADAALHPLTFLFCFTAHLLVCRQAHEVDARVGERAAAALYRLSVTFVEMILISYTSSPGKRMKWTPESESELLRLADDEAYRDQALGALVLDSLKE